MVGDSRKKWGYKELFWGGFLEKRKEKSWGRGLSEGWWTLRVLRQER